MSGRYYQLLSGHAVAGAYLAGRIKKIQSSEYWWRGSGERQTRRRAYRPPEQKDAEERREGMWMETPAPSIRTLFQDDRATTVALIFLRETKVGRVISLAPPPGVEEGG